MLVLSSSESMNKYSTKRTSSNCNSYDSYSKHRRDYTPSRSHSRNSSPESWSPRGPSSYSSKNYSSSSRRSRDRDHDRERTDNSKYYDGSSRSKYMRLSRSPLGHESSKSYRLASGGHSSSSRDTFYENNHNHNHNHSHNHHSSHSLTNSSHSSSSNGKRTRFGDWTEEISSSGKLYYYNTKTESSQWDKPYEWAEWEKRHSSKYSSSSSDKYAFSNHYRDKLYDANNSSSSSYKSHSNNYTSSRDRIKDDVYSLRHSSPRYASPDHRSHNSKSRDGEKRSPTRDIINKKPRLEAKEEHLCFVNDSSSSLNSTDSQCNILNNNNNHAASPQVNVSAVAEPNKLTNCTNKLRTSANTSTGLSVNSVPELSEKLSSSLVSAIASLVSTGQAHSSVAIAKLFSELSLSQGVPKLSEAETLLLLKQALNNTSQRCQVQPNSSHQNHNATSQSATTHSGSNHKPLQSPPSQSKYQSSSSKSHSQTSHQDRSNRHSNCVDGTNHRNDSVDSKSSQLPSSTHPINNLISNQASSDSRSSLVNNRVDNSVNALNLSTISLAIGSTVTQKNTIPILPRFKPFIKEELIGHVKGWPSKQLEEQAIQLLDQGNQMGNHLTTRVSAELKTARSFVRMSEIFTTGQKQRILFTSQHLKELEDWKGSHLPCSTRQD